MSYILDALRRADAERSRGAVPGLHAHNMPGDGEPAARNHAPLIWAAAAAGVLVVAGLVIVLFGPWHAAPAPDARATLAPAPELAPRDDAPALPARGEQSAPRPGALDPGARPIEPPIGRAAPPAYPPATPRRPPVAPARVATLEPRVDSPPPAAAAAPAQPPVEHYGATLPAAPTPASAPARGNAVTNINDLPPNVRSQLPRLTVGGAIYSETPSARMVILNGQVFHEGDKPAADTVLEQIRLKSAVLNFRGQRYEVAF
jgi:general secretion pathway protein B